jgi:hypothetical protein
MSNRIKNIFLNIIVILLSHFSDDHICNEHAQLLHRGDHTLPLRQDILHLHRYGVLTVANCCFILVPLSICSFITKVITVHVIRYVHKYLLLFHFSTYRSIWINLLSSVCPSVLENIQVKVVSV